LRFFDGFELVEPGLVYVPQWRPDAFDAVEHAKGVWIFGGVGRKSQYDEDVRDARLNTCV
jgi:S-adenosyl methyltransferase